MAKQWDGTVEKFDSNGNQAVFASGFFRPNWLAFDGSGNLFVTTILTVSNRVAGGTIEKIDSGGSASLFASTGQNNGYWGLACDSHGNLYAATYTDGTILKFDSSGTQSVFASGLNYPAGLAFDSNDNLYATIAADGTIEKFDSAGAGTIVASGLNFPLGIAVQPIPEPSASAMLLLGAGFLAANHRRKRWQASNPLAGQAHRAGRHRSPPILGQIPHLAL
jgi:sugar lactone lactonase YvrE